jgi:hypothetical protein
VLGLHVEAAEIFADHAEHEHLHGAEHDDDQHQRGPALDGGAGEESDRDIAEQKHGGGDQPQPDMARHPKRRRREAGDGVEGEAEHLREGIFALPGMALGAVVGDRHLPEADPGDHAADEARLLREADGAEQLGRVLEVGVDDQDPVPRAEIEAGGEGELVAVVARQVDRDQPGIARGERPHHLPAAVARAVVDEHDLIILARHAAGGRAQPRMKLAEARFLIVAGNDDREGGRAHSGSWRTIGLRSATRYSTLVPLRQTGSRPRSSWGSGRGGLISQT